MIELTFDATENGSQPDVSRLLIYALRYTISGGARLPALLLFFVSFVFFCGKKIKQKLLTEANEANEERLGLGNLIGRSMLDVRCSMFPLIFPL